MNGSTACRELLLLADVMLNLLLISNPLQIFNLFTHHLIRSYICRYIFIENNTYDVIIMTKKVLNSFSYRYE